MAEFYSIRIETNRLVAAKIHDASVAMLIDAGQPVLLATAEDLVRLALRLKRQLVTFSRIPARNGTAVRRPAIAGVVPAALEAVGAVAEVA